MLGRLVKQVRGLFADRQRQASRLKAARAIIGQSRLFDEQWYVEHYPDVAAAGLDPLDHFISHGAAEGRNPSNRFDLRWYVKRNPDVAGSRINPLLHYLEYGRDEGRSIRAVDSTSRADDDFDDVRQRGKAKTDEPQAQPFPSDFREIWQARPVPWSALPSSLRPNSEPESISRTADRQAPADWLADVLRKAPSATPEGARIRLFQAMHRSADPKGGTTATDQPNSNLASSQEAHDLLTTHGLGAAMVADGWFSGSPQLMLRLQNSSRGVARVRGFQYAASGEISCCGEAEIANGGWQLLSLALESELCPVLLTWQACDGTLAASGLIPFPSLFRGGLHHSEWAAREIISGNPQTLDDYMTALAGPMYCWPDPDDAFAIGRIVVDLAGANGTETLLNAEMIATLARQFGLTLEARNAENDDAARLLASRLPADLAGSRERAGCLLVLPADGFPSLHALAAREGDPQLGVSSYCVVDAGTRQPEALVCHPAALTGLSSVHHPALPLPFPLFEQPASVATQISRHFGAPVMIRFRDAKVWKVDPLMPIAPDIPMPCLETPPTPAHEKAPSLSIIIDRPTDGDLLSLCLTSLAHQTVAGDLEIILVGEADIPSTAAGLFADERIINCAVSDQTPAERFNRAASAANADYLLFLDGRACLPDPRTLGLLLAMARQPNIGSVSCALVREDSADGSTSIDCAGYFWECRVDQSTFEVIGTPTDLGGILPAATYPVIANSLHLCLVPRAVWRDLGGLNATDFPDDGYDIDFGLRARAAGFEHHCTTVTSAAFAWQEPAKPAVASARAPAAIPQALSQQVAQQVAHIKRLHR